MDEERSKSPQADDDAGPRRLMSLSSQRRRSEEAVSKKKDSRPPEDDPMARALELLSGIDENVRDAERPDPVTASDDADEAAAGEHNAEAPPAGEDGADRAAGLVTADAAPAVDSLNLKMSPDAGAAGDGEEAEGEIAEIRYEQVIRREDASPVVAKEAKRNPAKALYSLQQVHERTGIPYATLALYAATHAERIPSLGERRSPAYPRQGLEEFCRIYAENNPGWERPAIGSEEGWDDQDGLSRRIDALADGLDALHSDVREIHAIIRRGWTAEVSLYD